MTTAAEALLECSTHAPDLPVDEDDYRTLAVLVTSWMIDVREKARRSHLTGDDTAMTYTLLAGW